MGIFGRKKKKPETEPGEALITGATSTNAGVMLTEDSSMRFAAVQACVRVISEDIGALPMYIYRRTAQGGKERATDHPLYSLLHDMPNPEMTSTSFKEALMVNLLLTGNGYAFKEYDGAGHIKALYPIMSGDVDLYRDRIDRTIKYRIGGTVYGSDEIVHVVGLSYDGIVGMSPISYAREAIGLGIAAEKFGSNLFSKGANIGGVIELPGELSPEAYERTSAAFATMYKGLQNTHGVPILEGGAKYTRVSISPEDCQFLETRKYQRSEIAGVFRVPPHMIGDLEHATFSNIEQQDISYLQRGLLPWLRRIEQTFQNQVMPSEDRDTYFIEHDAASFLRGDIKSRFEAYGMGIQNGFMSRNEVRIKENMNPVDGGDELLIPLNMTGGGEAEDPHKQPDGQRRSFNMADIRDFTNDSRRLAVLRSANAAKDLGLRSGQIIALEKAFSGWLKRQAGEITEIVKRETGRRSKQEAQAIAEALDKYYAALAKEAVPKDITDSIDSIVGKAVEQVRADVETGEAEGIDEAWMRGFYERYYDSMKERLLTANRAEVERGLGDATKADVDRLLRKLGSWGKNRAANMAKTEAAWALNEGKLAAYRKCGYTGVWQSAAGCCKVCTFWNGTPVTTVKPPLHKGCTCTVGKGGKGS